MNATELEALKSSLLTQKSELLNKTHEFYSEQSVQKTAISDEAEAASVDFENTLSIHLHERDRNALLLIEKSLAKLAEGKYGLCEACGEQIAAKRLMARPFTSLCIECMEEKEEQIRLN